MGKTKKDTGQNDAFEKSNSDNLNRKIDDYRYILDSINSWIVSADNKVSIYCGMYSVVIAAITFIANHVLGEICVTTTDINKNAYIWFIFLVIMAISAFLGSMLFYTLSVKPDLTGKKQTCENDKKSENKLSLFYRDISKFDTAEDFIQVALKADNADYFRELLAEVYYNSKVCKNKMKYFQIAVILSFIAVTLIVGACVAYYFTYCTG